MEPRNLRNSKSPRLGVHWRLSLMSHQLKNFTHKLQFLMRIVRRCPQVISVMARFAFTALNGRLAEQKKRFSDKHRTIIRRTLLRLKVKLEHKMTKEKRKRKYVKRTCFELSSLGLGNRLGSLQLSADKAVSSRSRLSKVLFAVMNINW